MFNFLKRKSKVRKFKEEELSLIRRTFHSKEKHPDIAEIFNKYDIVNVWANMRVYSGVEYRKNYKKDDVVYINFYYNNDFVVRVYNDIYLAEQNSRYDLYIKEPGQKESLIKLKCPIDDDQIKKLNEEFSNLLVDCYQYWEKEQKKKKKEEEMKKMKEKEKENEDKKLLDQFMKSRLS